MPAPQPVMQPAPQMVMQPAAAASVPMMVQAAAQPASFVPATVTTTTTPARNRLALGMDFVRIPFPVPRLFRVPGVQRTVTETEVATTEVPVQASFASAAAVQQFPVAAQPAFAQAVVPAQQMVMPQSLPVTQFAAPAAMAAVAPQPAAVMPAQYMMAPAAPAAMMAAAPQMVAPAAIAMPQFVPQAAPQAAAAPTHVCFPIQQGVAGAASQPASANQCQWSQAASVNPETLNELSKQIQAVRQLLDDQSGVRGTPLPPIGSR